MRFCANVSIPFKEVPFLEQFRRATRAGFSAVGVRRNGEPEEVLSDPNLNHHEPRLAAGEAYLAPLR